MKVHSSFILPVALCLLATFSLVSCSGYKVRGNQNPFENDGIYRVSLPMFINQSSIANVSGIFTSEVARILQDFPGLKVYSGENLKADAILLGIIHSPKRMKDIFNRNQTSFTHNEISSSLGNRPDFYYPTSTKYKISLQLILIKNPSIQELNLLRSQLGQKIENHPKIIFNTIFEKEVSFSRQVKETQSADSSGIVNFTTTKHSFEKSLAETAVNTATDFKELVLNVF